MIGAIYIILILLAISVLCLLFSKCCDLYGKNKYGEENWNKIMQATIDAENRKKYNNYMLTCPICRSKNIKKITDINKTFSVMMLGVASSKIGKQYECENCQHKW